MKVVGQGQICHGRSGPDELADLGCQLSRIVEPSVRAVLEAGAEGTETHSGGELGEESRQAILEADILMSPEVRELLEPL